MDFISDLSGRHLVRLYDTVDLPDYVKSAAVGQEVADALGNHQFADTAARLFPIDNPGHVFMSLGYCKSAGITQDRILSRIKSAGQKFGITKDLEAIELAFDSQTKSAATTEEKAFAVKVDFGPGNPEAVNPMEKSGGVRGFYPIGNPDEVETSAIKLANERSRIPLALFVEGSRNIVKAANTFNMPTNTLPRTVMAYGMERFPNFEHVEFEAEQREKSSGDSRYMDIAKSAAVNGDQEPMDSYIELWRDLDSQNGIVPSRSNPDPYSIFNSGMPKAAYEAELDTMTVIAETAVPLSAISELREEKVARHFNATNAVKIKDIVKSAAKGNGPQVTVLMETLEAPVQMALLKMLL